MTHTNNDIPSDLKVSRSGDLLILKTRTATIRLDFKRRKELADAILSLT